MSKKSPEANPLFAAPIGPDEWDGRAIPFTNLYDVSRIDLPAEHTRLLASGVAYHLAGLRESQRHVLTCPPGQVVPLEVVRVGLGAVRAAGLLRVVVDRRITIPADETGRPPLSPGRNQAAHSFGRTVREMDGDMVYAGRGARREERGPEGERIVYSRTVEYGGAWQNGNALGLVASAHVERATERQLQVWPGDMVVEQAYSVAHPNSGTEELVRLTSAAVLLTGNVPTQRMES